jgi:hypothetical protein
MVNHGLQHLNHLGGVGMLQKDYARIARRLRLLVEHHGDFLEPRHRLRRTAQHQRVR